MVQMTTLRIGGMSCGACVRHVARALDGLTGVVHVEVNLQEQQATIEHLADWADEASLVAAVKDAGYVARAVGRDIYTQADERPKCCGG